MLNCQIFEGTTHSGECLTDRFSDWLNQTQDSIEIVSIHYAVCGHNLSYYDTFDKVQRVHGQEIIHNILVIYRTKESEKEV